nr:thymidine phosphorylase [Eubacterium sp.]
MERFVDVIHKKKIGYELSDSEIENMIHGYCDGTIPDYQMSAMLMAICFNGLSDRELTTLTLAMRDSGQINDLSQIPGIKVDKHSTGGVGDKTTLIIGPVVAACGIPIAKMSGRGLGFTGGTIDKLESIPGFRTDLSNEDFFRAVQTAGICVNGQTADLAPADKLIYALRDVTATVESIPLIAASIMSKKLAAGSDCIVLDVTTGNGAFIKDYEQSLELAQKMVTIGNNAGKTTIAQLTSMDEPLGFAIGNNLEVKEAIDALHGNGPEDLMQVCYSLAAHMISLGKNISYEQAEKEAREAIESGRAWDVFLKMVAGQGGDISYMEHPNTLPQAPIVLEYQSPSDGYITFMDTEGFGNVAGILGAGRSKKEDAVDFTAGIVLQHKINDFVKEGEVLATLYTSDQTRGATALSKIKNCYELSAEPGKPIRLIGDVIR